MAVTRDVLESIHQRRSGPNPGSDLFATVDSYSLAKAEANVTVVSYSYPIGDARRYGAKIDNVTDDTVAYQASITVARQSLSVEAYWPQGTARVSFLTIASSCRIRTAGKLTIFQQIAGQAPGTPIISITDGDVELGSCQGIGNIASDTGEQMHFIQVSTLATLRRIRLGDLAAQHIRGDVLRIAGTAANPLYNFHAGTITGTDIYRNLVSCVGVEDCFIESIVNTGGGVGYRDFDMEPNSSGQFCTAIRIGYLYGANFQGAGGNISGGMGTLRIDHCDLDNNRLANASQGYPSFPGSSGNIGAILGDLQQVSIGTLRARNYQERLLNCNGNTISKVSIKVENADISNCNTTETTFKNLFNCDGAVTLEILGGTIALTALDRYITKGNANLVRLRDLNVSGGPIAAFATNSEFENLTVNSSSLASTIFGNLINCLIKNCVFSNDGSATLFVNCTGNLIVNTTTSPSAVEGSGCAGNIAMNSTLKSILYGPPTLISAAVAAVNMNNTNQTLTAIQGIAISITCTSTPTAMTAPRNLVVPTTPRVYTVFNNNGSGNGIQVIAASGTGTTIADGKRAIVEFDGTNVVRVTPDT